MKLVLFLLIVLQVVYCGYGDEKEGYPSYPERISHALTNAARTSIFFHSNS